MMVKVGRKLKCVKVFCTVALLLLILVGLAVGNSVLRRRIFLAIADL